MIFVNNCNIQVGLIYVGNGFCNSSNNNLPSLKTFITVNDSFDDLIVFLSQKLLVVIYFETY